VLAELDPKTQGPRVVNGQSFSTADIASLQLAVLSACHTRNEAQPGDTGTKGLAQALLEFRVPHVVVSRWSIDSRTTAELMNHFYAALMSGSEIGTAMQKAEMDLASNAASAHPYYWSAFEVERNN